MLDPGRSVFAGLLAAAQNPAHEIVDMGHGRIKRRRCAGLGPRRRRMGRLRQPPRPPPALRIERERHILKTGKRSVEVSCSLASGPDRAGPEELLALARNHWHTENRLHYVRDFTYDEGRCRVQGRHLPRNLACLTNAAIAIVLSNGRFRYLPGANRHYAAHAQAVDAILIVPTPQ